MNNPLLGLIDTGVCKKNDRRKMYGLIGICVPTRILQAKTHIPINPYKSLYVAKICFFRTHRYGGISNHIGICNSLYQYTIISLVSRQSLVRLQKGNRSTNRTRNRSRAWEIARNRMGNRAIPNRAIAIPIAIARFRDAKVQNARSLLCYLQ